MIGFSRDLPAKNTSFASLSKLKFLDVSSNNDLVGPLPLLSTIKLVIYKTSIYINNFALEEKDDFTPDLRFDQPLNFFNRSFVCPTLYQLLYDVKYLNEEKALILPTKLKVKIDVAPYAYSYESCYCSYGWVEVNRTQEGLHCLKCDDANFKFFDEANGTCRGSSTESKNLISKLVFVFNSYLWNE